MTLFDIQFLFHMIPPIGTHHYHSTIRRIHQLERRHYYIQSILGTLSTVFLPFSFYCFLLVVWLRRLPFSPGRLIPKWDQLSYCIIMEWLHCTIAFSFLQSLIQYVFVAIIPFKAHHPERANRITSSGGRHQVGESVAALSLRAFI